MKPSDRIFQIVKELATEDAKRRGGYFGWEGLEGLTEAIIMNEGQDFLAIAIVKYLDEVKENP